MDEETPSAIVEGNLRDFFHDLILEAASHHRASVSPPAMAYITDVLFKFHETAHLFDQQGVRIPVLADMLSLAMEADFYRRISLLQQMGDTSLMVSSYFPEALARRCVDVSYYQRMGEIAYSQLGSLTEEDSVFEELSEQFVDLSRLISHVAETTSPKSYSVVKLIDLYMKTGSHGMLDQLKSQGVIPLRRNPGRKPFNK